MQKSTITCDKLNKEVRINQGESVFNQLLDANIPIASSCRGQGVCKWCKVEILAGNENLNSKTILEEKASLIEKERLLCQLTCNGDVKIDANYW